MLPPHNVPVPSRKIRERLEGPKKIRRVGDFFPENSPKTWMISKLKSGHVRLESYMYEICKPRWTIGNLRSKRPVVSTVSCPEATESISIDRMYKRPVYIVTYIHIEIYILYVRKIYVYINIIYIYYAYHRWFAVSPIVWYRMSLIQLLCCKCFVCGSRCFFHLAISKNGYTRISLGKDEQPALGLRFSRCILKKKTYPPSPEN